MAYPPQRRMSFGPRLTKGVAWILGLEVGAFLLYLFSSEGTRARLVRWLALTGDSLTSGHVWKLATTSLLNLRGASVFFDLLMLWLFVPVLEHAWGTRRFLRFAVLTAVLGNLASALVGLALDPFHPIVGLSPFIYASIAAYGVLFAHKPVQLFAIIPLKGRTLAIGTAALVALFVALEGAWIDGAGYFAAMGAAWVTASGAVTPNLWWLRLRRWRLRRRYHVIDGGRAGDGKKRWMN